MTPLLAAWIAIMEAMGNAVHTRSKHAYRPTPPRPHFTRRRQPMASRLIRGAFK